MLRAICLAMVLRVGHGSSHSWHQCSHHIKTNQLTESRQTLLACSKQSSCLIGLSGIVSCTLLKELEQAQVLDLMDTSERRMKFVKQDF